MRLLFVCTGNICRSPSAEAVARARLSALSLDWQVDSAATSRWHVGQSPDKRSRRAAEARGYPMDDLTARALVVTDYMRFDHILAMDAGHERHLQRKAPPGATARISRLLDWAAECDAADVPDPYYGSAQGFDDVLDLVERGVDALIEALRDTDGQASG